MATWYLSNTNSDLTTGADFKKKLLTTTESANSINFSIAANSTETSYAYSEPFSPNNADWETGGITVKVNVLASDSFALLKVNATRLNASGGVEEQATATAEQALALAGVFTFNIASKNWTAGTSSDRLRIDYIFRNSSTKGAQSVTIETGTSDTSITTSITINAFPRIAHKAVFQVQTDKRIANTIAFQPWNPNFPTNWYKRRLIDFGTNHDELPIGYTALSTGFQTGYADLIASNGLHNESIEHPGRQVAYYNNYLYFAWLGPPATSGNFRIYMCKYSYASDTYSSVVNVTDALTSSDLHHYPSLLITSNGKIHIFFGSHNATQKYIRSTNAEDITAWDSVQNIGTGSDYSTYPKAIQRSNGDIILFCRGYATNNPGVYGFFKSTDGGATWGSKQAIAKYNSPGITPASLYNGGVVQDATGRVHVVLLYQEGYQNVNKGRYVTYIYSDDLTSWKNMAGTTIGTTETDPVLETDIEKIFESGDPWPDTGPFWHTNSEALALDGDNYPYFLVGDTGDGVSAESPIWLCRWNGTAWVKTELSALSGGKKAWSRRYIGALYVDGDEIHIYATTLPESSSEEYFGGEIFKYRSTDLGQNWAQFFYTKSSGYGIPQVSVLPQKISGKNKELFFSRGTKLYRLEDIDYADVLPGGDDSRIIRHTQTGNFTYSTTSLDRVPKDQFGLVDTATYFKLDRPVPANMAHPHPYERYYQYYKNPTASNPPRDPDNVFVFYDGCEGYSANSQIQGQNGWSGSTKFTCMPNPDDEVKIYSGYKVFKGHDQTANPADFYIERSLSLDKHLITVTLWNEIATHLYFEIRDSGSGKWYEAGINTASAKFIYRRNNDGGTWTEVSSPLPIKGANIIQMKLSSSGVSLWLNGATVLTDDTFNSMTSSDKFRLGIIGVGPTLGYFDQIIIQKWVSNGEEITHGSEEFTTLIDSKKIAHQAAPQATAISRIASNFELKYPSETRRIAHYPVGDKRELKRIASSMTGLITTNKRLRHEIDRVYAGEKKLAHSIVREVAEAKRIAQQIAGDKSELKRLASGASLDKADLRRIINKIVGEIIADLKLAHGLDLRHLADQRIASQAKPEKAELKRIINKIIPESADQERIMNALFLQAGADKRLAGLLSLEASFFKRIAHKVDFTAIATLRVSSYVALVSALSIRLAHFVAGNATGSKRTAHILQMQPSITKRIAHQIIAELASSRRIAHTVSGAKTAESRVAVKADPQKTAERRLADLISLDKIQFNRLASAIIFIAPVQGVKLLNARGSQISLENPVAAQIALLNASGSQISLDNPVSSQISLTNARGSRITLDNPTVH